METTAVRVKSHPVAMSIAKTFAIVISFAALYWALCMLNPVLAQSNLVLVFGKSFRIANLLKAFVLWNPFVAVGTFVGAQAFDATVGRSLLPIDVVGLMQVALGFGAYGLSRLIGRAVWKDLLVLFLYGMLSSILGAVGIAMIAVVFLHANDTITGLFKEIVLWKMVTKTLLFLAGYPIFLAFEAGVAKWRK